MKDSRGHGSEARGKIIPSRPPTQSEYPAHAQGTASTPHVSYLTGNSRVDQMIADMKAFPLVPPSSAPRTSLPDARLASWKRTVTVPGR